MTTDRMDPRTGEIVPVTTAPPVSPLMLRPAMSVADVKARVDFIREIQREVMERDIHYGVIPGTGTKPTLLKPGAELLCVTFQLDPEYDVLPISVQSETFINYVVRCSLRHIPTGQIIATGLGACNSREEKYAYRHAARTCPMCGKATIIRGREEYGGGWLCYSKKGGCGAKYRKGDPAIEQQEAGRIANPNIWDLANTLLKMGCKRSHIAGTLNGTAASDVFTQDLELDEETDNEGPRAPAPPGTTTTSPNGPPNAATPDQLRAIGAIARKAGQEIHAFVAATLGRPLPTRPDKDGQAVPTLDGLTWAEAKRCIDAGQVATQAPLPGTQARGRP